MTEPTFISPLQEPSTIEELANLLIGELDNTELLKATLNSLTLLQAKELLEAVEQLRDETYRKGGLFWTLSSEIKIACPEVITF
jgi:hypothetical protein